MPIMRLLFLSLLWLLWEEVGATPSSPPPLPQTAPASSEIGRERPPNVSMDPPPKSEGPPIEVDAGSLIADQKANSVSLKDRVEMVHGDMHLWADEADGIAPPGTRFGFKNPETIEARGRVVAKTEAQMGYADTATYCPEEQHLHLQGKEVHLMGNDHRLTARESADYWGGIALKAVARKNVIFQTKDKIIKTDELWLLFEEDAEGCLEIIFAWSPTKISIATPTVMFIGDRGSYDPVTGIVILEGNVSMTRLSDQSHLCGAYGVLCLDTGVAHVYAKRPFSDQTTSIPIQGRLSEKKESP
ncbi:MAG: hypothetical protein LBD66_01325 [Holosporales bacterium]|nr:hypothetical protein [Holosporales bacterium]